MKQLPNIYPVTNHTDHVGPGSTYVAINGLKEDGVKYIPQALAQGAATIIVSDQVTLPAETAELITKAGAQVVPVGDPRKAFAELAAQANGYPAKDLKIVGITGTKGKTSSTYLLYHMLKTAGKRVALLGTVKNFINDQEFEATLTTPQPDYLQAFLTQCKQEGIEIVVMEVSAQALSLHRLATIQFDAAAFTNFSQEHSEFYATQDEYFKAKCQLFDQVVDDGRIVLNADDKQVAQCVPNLPRTFISMKDNGGLTAKIIKSSLKELVLQVNSDGETYELASSSLLGEFSGYNILTAVALAQRYGVSFQMQQRALSSFKGVPGRVASYPLANGAVAIIDNAHTPSSFEAFFKAARPLSNHIIAVFGAGGDRDTLKRPLMGAVAAKYADQVVLTTDNPRSEDPAAIVQQIQQGIDGTLCSKVAVELDRERAIKEAYTKTKKGSLLVLLGKGPVEYQHIEDEKIPFSEETILKNLRS